MLLVASLLVYYHVTLIEFVAFVFVVIAVYLLKDLYILSMSIMASLL